MDGLFASADVFHRASPVPRYLPLKLGCLFSLNALTPSAASSVA
jgi:hypothetical protein